MTLVLVMAGGALGALCRFLVDRAVTAALGGALPWGTFTVNVAGSLLLGLVAGAGSGSFGWLGPLVGTGFCGALTTYSTFSYETVWLSARRPGGSFDNRPGGNGRAALNVAATLFAGLGAAGLGWLLAEQIC